jgi:Uma2 family endonuclease
MSLMSVVSHSYSPEELLRFQSESGVELVHGHIVEKPVSIESSDVEATLVQLLKNEAGRERKAKVFPSSMGYQCFPEEPQRYRKPDVSVVRSEKLAGFDPQTGLIPFPPDLAVEVISPNDLAYAVFEKIEEYLANGFQLIWVVQPNTRTVTIYRGDGTVAVRHERDEITGEAALPSFRCKVAEIFQT